jgi:glycosyltransferase involved in cell wall biosynthesis
MFANTKLTLCMIVKNESRIIRRLLDSLVDGDKKAIDYISILDTGSTDNTKQLIEKWGEEHKIPTKVHSKPFTNFGESRTLSFKLAKETFPSDYTLLLDADFELEIKSWDNPPLTHDCYMVQQRSSTIKYWNVRLIKTSLDWICRGVTHEYWYSPGATEAQLTSLVIDDREDGGCKEDKLTRDTKLLLAGIKSKKTPEDLKIRYYFYLAQTYKDRKMYLEAIQYYKLRIQAGGWVEEVFYSIFQLANCLMGLKKDAEAIVTYLDAWNLRPSRIEPLLPVITYYRERAKYNLAFLYALRAKAEPIPNDLLFVDTRCWDYLLDYELSIIAYYCDEKELGLEASERLLASRAPEPYKDAVRANLKYYQ